MIKRAGWWTFVSATLKGLQPRVQKCKPVLVLFGRDYRLLLVLVVHLLQTRREPPIIT